MKLSWLEELDLGFGVLERYSHQFLRHRRAWCLSLKALLAPPRHGFEICGALVVTATGILIIDVILARPGWEALPKGPCTQIVYTLGPMYQTLFNGLSIYLKLSIYLSIQSAF